MRARLALLLLLALGGCNMVNGPPRDGECRGNLRSIIGGEQALYSEQRRFSIHPAEVGFAPTPGNRYLYLFSAEGPVSRRDDLESPPLRDSVGIGPDTRSRNVKLEWLRARFPPEVLSELGVRGQCPECTVTVGCAGNIDDDETVDVWSISSADRIIDGHEALRGSPYRHVNDRER